MTNETGLEFENLPTTLLEKEYTDEEMWGTLESDVSDIDFDDFGIPTDEDGFRLGKFKLTLEWIP